MGRKSKKEPSTDQEFEEALEALGCKVIDHGDSFSIRNEETRSTTRLEARDWSSALFEAWNLMKD